MRGVYAHNRSNQQQHAPPENLSSHKTHLFQKRIACTTAPGPFCEERVSFFEFREGAASVRKQREAIPCNSSEKPTQGVTRCPSARRSPAFAGRRRLNALAEQMRRCRLIFGPPQCGGNSILRLRRLASSSEKPIHLSWNQRPWRQPFIDSSHRNVDIGESLITNH